MERLILKYTAGDGYSYRCDVVLPIRYLSKEDALDDFELLLLQYSPRQDNINVLEQECKILFDKAIKNNNLQDADWLDKREEIDNLKTSCNVFEFAGRKFAYEEFLCYNDTTKQYTNIMPEILTLDEWYNLGE